MYVLSLLKIRSFRLLWTVFKEGKVILILKISSTYWCLEIWILIFCRFWLLKYLKRILTVFYSIGVSTWLFFGGCDNMSVCIWSIWVFIHCLSGSWFNPSFSLLRRLGTLGSTVRTILEDKDVAYIINVFYDLWLGFTILNSKWWVILFICKDLRLSLISCSKNRICIIKGLIKWVNSSPITLVLSHKLSIILI